MAIDPKKIVYRDRGHLLKLFPGAQAVISENVQNHLEQIDRCMAIAREVIAVSGEWKIPYPSRDYFDAVRESYLITIAVRGWPDNLMPRINVLECLALVHAERALSR